LDAICPPSSSLSQKGEIKHIILEGNSFPSGGFDDEEDGNDTQLTNTTYYCL
jgi:hypothetical protein